MENTNNNVRTLVVSFVVAIMALIPLRFVEAGQEINFGATNNQILGETNVVEEVVLPNAEVDSQASCVSQDQINLAWEGLKLDVQGGRISTDQLKEATGMLIELEKNNCQ